MKILITENQNDALIQTIKTFIENNIIPEDDWDTHEVYRKDLKSNGGEVFINLENYEYDDSHIWYSICNNKNLEKPINSKYCPVVAVPKSIFNSLEGFFGIYWKPIFIKWFEEKTGLKAKNVDIL